jgi:lipopolysaccharide/colanic/teichoic acid biosynthesis glycosyltransferase
MVTAYPIASEEQLRQLVGGEPRLILWSNPCRLRYPIQWALKCLFDRMVATLALLFLSPVFLLIGLLIKLDSPGPVFFRQTRVGIYGSTFEMLKFRSMVADAEAKQKELEALNETNAVMFKMAKDPRVTRLGAWLRKTSLDELPQLINVAFGEMSLVGPRPPLPKEVILFDPAHYRKFQTMPGITGLWQISGRADIRSFDQVIDLDTRYIATWNFWQDIQLLFKTVPVVLFSKGAY